MSKCETEEFEKNRPAAGMEKGDAGEIEKREEEADTENDNEEDFSGDENDENDEEDREKVCIVCHRPESKTGGMITMPGNLTICRECMQRAFDSFSQNGGMPYGFQLNLGETEDGENPLSVLSGLPNVGVINLADLGIGGQEIPKNQRVKKKKAKKEKKVFSRDMIPAPHELKHMLDEYVVGQEKAKKAISVAVYNHYKRVFADPGDGVEIEKSNMLLLGPTGSGKTYLVKTLAKLLDVPLAIADATSLTEAGYIGDDIESVVSKLLAAAGNDVDRAQQGIIYIDEIDKIAKKKNSTTRDVSGESVQQELLKMLEGSRVEVPVGSNSKNAMVPMTTVSTDNILFICGGAFPDLEDIIKERLTKESSIGFKAELRDRFDQEENLLCKAQIDDLKKFGMIPEFLGRLPVIVSLEALTADYLVRILKEPRNAILKQYEKLLRMDEVQLCFEDEALQAIAEKALKRHTGARALRAILEEYMLDIMYEIPKDDNIGRVTITKDYVEGTGGPVIELRGMLEIGMHA